jgi:hypothetical protein
MIEMMIEINTDKRVKTINIKIMVVYKLIFAFGLKK